MKVSNQRSYNWRGSNWLLFVFSICLGCAPGNQLPARGRIALSTDSGFTFAGDTIELRDRDQPTRLAFGQIQPDGSFVVESLIDGKIVSGAPAGKYQARLVISDDDYEHKQRAKKAIPKKFFSFDTSDLLVEVPASDIQLKLSP